MKLGRFACSGGIGLLAGAIGTAAMTLSQMIEMKVVGRKPSAAPAKVVENVFAIEPADEASESLLARLGHWSYGIAWGAFRGFLAAAGLKPWTANTIQFTILQGAAVVITAGLKVAPPLKDWSRRQLALEAVHHLVYAVVCGLAYEYFRRDAECR